MSQSGVQSAHETTSIDAQIQFARHNYEAQQSMIRLADAKAGMMVSLLVFLGYSGFLITRAALDSVRWRPEWNLVLSAVFVATGVGFLAGVLWTLSAVLHVVAPRVRRLPFQPGRDLFFSADVASYSSRDEYFEALRASPNPLLLRNLSDQIFEVAGIAETKLKALAKVKTPLLLSFWCWAGNMLASFLLLYLHSGQK